MRHRPLLSPSLRAGVAVLVGSIVVAAASSRAAMALPGPEPAAPPTYAPPVDAPLADTFRPPATPDGPGNRGIDYATTEGQPVRAAAVGEVVFAGRIGSAHHVTVLHDDGIRTSYSFLATTAVRRGQRVNQGDPLGTTGPAPLHLGARTPDGTYLDPLLLFGQPAGDNARHPTAYLVDDPDPTEPLTEAEERRLVVDAITAIAHTATGAAGWIAEATADEANRKLELLRILADDAIDLGLPMPVHLAVATARWHEERRQQRCAPAEAGPTPTTTLNTTTTGTRRVVILVGGLGSATGNAAVLETDTRALGYANEDVHQFSYRPDGEPYGPEDTQGDIDVQAKRLATQITEAQRANPDAKVDVIAHSQGGLVARAAVTRHKAAPATLVTLGTPHQGSDIATAGAATRLTTSGRLLLEGATEVTNRRGTGLDLNSTSIEQMGETSDFITDLPEEGWDPAITHVVSIAARADPVVPNHQSRLPGPDAYNTVVTPHGTSSPKDHSALPGSPEATAEIRRAQNRLPPTCRTLEELALDTLVGHQISNAHDTIGAALATGGLFVDHGTGRRFANR